MYLRSKLRPKLTSSVLLGELISSQFIGEPDALFLTSEQKRNLSIRAPTIQRLPIRERIHYFCVTCATDYTLGLPIFRPLHSKQLLAAKDIMYIF